MIAALFTIVLILIFVALFISFKAFRWAVAIFVAVCVVGIAALINWSEENSKKYQRERDAEEAQKQQQALQIERQIAERSRMIKVEDLQVRDAKLSGVDANYFRTNTLTASLFNNSSVDLSSLVIFVRLYDCNGPPFKNYANCEIIGEDTASVDAQVPAKQTRQVIGHFSFSNTPKPRNRLAWVYEIRSIRAL